MSSHIIIKNKIRSFNKRITVSGDKSISIRCVLLASQAIGPSKIFNLLESEDVINALKSIRKLGVSYRKFKKFYKINGYGLNSFGGKKKIVINAGNSGTFARLVLGTLVNTKNIVKVIGDKSLSKRDFSRITNPLKNFGVNISSTNNCLPVKIEGSEYLRPINYFEKIGSAQCKSAVMLAAIKTPGTTKIKAKKSRDHTEILLKNLKIPIKISKKKKFDYFEIKGPSNYSGFNYNVPGDISSAAFFLVMTLLCKRSKITISNVNINKTRTGIIEILNQMNAKLKIKNKRIYKGELTADIVAESKSNLQSIDCPKNINSSAIDEFLIIFLVAAKAKGVSKFYDLGEMNKKESRRLDIAIKFLKMIGVKVSRNNNSIKIYGNPSLNLKGKYEMKDFQKDHRVFMMSCIAALTFGGYWKIHNKESTNTSFPNFFKIMRKLGVRLN